MKKYALPTRRRCLSLLKEHQVPSHIVKHSIAVAKVAVFLAERLREKGVAVDVNLVDRACLLHDIFRICDFKESGNSKFEQKITQKSKSKQQQTKAHEDAAYNLLKEKYPTLALTVKKHRYTALLDEKERPDTWEEKLVYYADKRVMHNSIVSLKERLEEAHKRNAPHPKAQGNIDTAEIDRLIYKLEEEIFDKIGLNPLEVTAEFINSHPNRNRTKD
jgi:uncharacterized protein